MDYSQLIHDIAKGHADILRSGIEAGEQSAKSEIERLRTINADLMEALCEFMDDAYLDNGTLCGWCGYRTEVGSGHLHNRVCRVGKAEAAIAKAEGR